MRGRRARPSGARWRPGSGAGPSVLGPAGRRAAPPRLLRTWARGAGGCAAWLCRRQPGPPCGHCGFLARAGRRPGRVSASLRAPSGSAPLAPLRPHHPPYPRWRRPSHGVSPPTLDGRRGCTKVGARGRAAANGEGRVPEPPRLPPARGAGLGRRARGGAGARRQVGLCVPPGSRKTNVVSRALGASWEAL